MTKEEIQKLIKLQKEQTLSLPPVSVKERVERLTGLARSIRLHEEEVYDALKKDLNKSREEAYMCEIGGVLGEIAYMKKHVKSFAMAKRVHTGLVNYPAKSYIRPTPMGCCLVMAPWNYPFLLSLEPLVDALAAGNTAILRPSSSAPHVAAVLEKIISEAFDEKIVKVIICDRDTGTFLMEQDFDKIFFTGSPTVGKEVLRHAAEHYIPVTLELGGKSPCVVDASADIKLSARRIVFGKLLNAGQTCVAPDYIYCEACMKDELVEALISEIKAQYTDNPMKNESFPRIINQSQFDRLSSYLDPEKIIYGGRTDEKNLKIEPTILNAEFTDDVMKEEIFGPILPIVTYETSDEAVRIINGRPTPLALYVFAKDKKVQEKFMSSCEFGGGCVNDTIMHLTGSTLPFGGRRQSGMGSYHGKAGFDAFTHYKSVLNKSVRIDMRQRYMPITEKKMKSIKRFLK
ncbi:MAG: aldehyde dehydrogenase [Clostridia bacterium]|nr:aldehyde dehydrogenase [Clostridia bacterium]